eukprot:7947473-Ditylum_brightwellii.AAC.1
MRAAMIESHPSVECFLSSAIQLVSHMTKKNVSKTSKTLSLPPAGLTDGIVSWQFPVAIWDVYNKQDKEVQYKEGSSSVFVHQDREMQDVTKTNGCSNACAEEGCEGIP